MAASPDNAGQAQPGAEGVAAGAGQAAPGGQQTPAGQAAGAGQAAAGQAASEHTETPGLQAGGYRLTLTEAQRKALLDGQPLELSDEQYTAGVRTQIATLKGRATTAERKLGEIAAAQEETERKALIEQERFKELYEREKVAGEKLTAARQTDLVRAEFLLAATKLNLVDPAGAFLLAKAMPAFAETIRVSEEGAVTGLDDVLKSLVEQKPYLVASGQQRVTTIGGPANPPSGQPPAAPTNLAEAGNELVRRVRQGLG